MIDRFKFRVWNGIDNEWFTCEEVAIVPSGQVFAALA